MILIKCLKVFTKYLRINTSYIPTDEENVAGGCEMEKKTKEVEKFLIKLVDVSNIDPVSNINEIFINTIDNKYALKIGGCAVTKSPYVSEKYNIPISELIISYKNEIYIPRVSLTNVHLCTIGPYSCICLTQEQKNEVMNMISNYTGKGIAEFRIKIYPEENEILVLNIHKIDNNNFKVFRKFTNTDMIYYNDIIRRNYLYYYKCYTAHLFLLIRCLCDDIEQENLVIHDTNGRSISTPINTSPCLFLYMNNVNRPVFNFLSCFSIEIFLDSLTSKEEENLKEKTLWYTPCTGIKFSPYSDNCESNITLKFTRYLFPLVNSKKKLMYTQLPDKHMNISLRHKSLNKAEGTEVFLNINSMGDIFQFTLSFKKKLKNDIFLNIDKNFEKSIKPIELEIYTENKQPTVLYMKIFTLVNEVDTFFIQFDFPQSESKSEETMLFDILTKVDGVFGIKVRSENNVIIEYKIQMFVKHIDVLSCNRLEEHIPLAEPKTDVMNIEVNKDDNEFSHHIGKHINNIIHNKETNETNKDVSTEEIITKQMKKSKDNSYEHVNSISDEINNILPYSRIISENSTKRYTAVHENINSPNTTIGNNGGILSAKTIDNVNNKPPSRVNTNLHELPTMYEGKFYSGINTDEMPSREENIKSLKTVNIDEGIHSRLIKNENMTVNDTQGLIGKPSIVSIYQSSENISDINDQETSIDSSDDSKNLFKKTRNKNKNKTIIFVGFFACIGISIGIIVYVRFS